MDVEQAARRFEQSKLVQRLWPPGLRARSRDLFATQRLVNAVTSWPRRATSLEDLHDLLGDSRLETLPLRVAGSSPVLQEIGARAWAEGARSPPVQAQMAIGALARRDYARAAALFGAAAVPGGPGAISARIHQAFALLMAERTAEARAVLATVDPASTASPTEQQNLRWLRAMLP